MAESGMSTSVKLAVLAIFFIALFLIAVVYNSITAPGTGNINTSVSTVAQQGLISSAFSNSGVGTYSNVLAILKETFNSTQRITVNYTELENYPATQNTTAISYNYSVSIQKYYDNVSYTYIGVQNGTQIISQQFYLNNSKQVYLCTTIANVSANVSTNSSTPASYCIKQPSIVPVDSFILPNLNGTLYNKGQRYFKAQSCTMVSGTGVQSTNVCSPYPSGNYTNSCIVQTTNQTISACISNLYGLPLNITQAQYSNMQTNVTFLYNETSIDTSQPSGPLTPPASAT